MVLSKADKKRIVVDFYEKVVNQRDFEAASKYLGSPYIQHRADAADGAEGLKEFIARMRAKFPDSHCEIKRVFVDGSYVILHVHVVRELGARGSKHVDIFRLEGDKVVEHWDIDEPISEQTANPDSVF